MIECAKCGAWSQPQARFCRGCGVRIAGTDSAAQGSNPHPLADVARASQIPPLASPREPRRESPLQTLRITYQGEFFVVNVKVTVLLDGAEVGHGSVKDGVDICVPCPSGSHELEVRHSWRKKNYTLELVGSGPFEARLSYSRLMGNFSGDVRLSQNALRA